MNAMEASGVPDPFRDPLADHPDAEDERKNVYATGVPHGDRLYAHFFGHFTV